MYIKNAKFITVIFSFSKRILICLLCIILAFNIVCKPKNVHAAALGTVTTWGLAEYLAALVASAGIATTVYEFLEGLGIFENKDKPLSEDQALNWCKNNISVDGDNNVVFTDEAKQFINNYILGTYNDSVKMTYRYFFNPDNVDFSIIENKDVRDELVRVMKEYPAFHFVITGRVANEVGQGPAFWILLNDDLEYAVCANNDLGIITKDTLYTSNWNNPVPQVKICIFDKARDDGLYWGYQIPSKPDQTQYYASFDDIYKMYKNGELASSTFSADYLYQLPLAPSRTTKLKLTSWRCPISADSSAINCYKSVADMKSDTGNYKVGVYTSDYTGQPNYNITTSEVNNIVNNYYNDSGGGSGSGGGGSGSDDSGGGSSILDGLGKVFGAIGKVIDKIIGFLLDIIAKIVEGFTKILDLFAGTFTKLVDLVPSGFNDFLSAMFPYIPEDWITLITASITIFALGTIFWFFRGR